MNTAPNVKTSIKDPKSQVTYHVMAYRALTREELVFAVRSYLGQRGAKKAKAGTEVTIISTIGA